MCGIVGLLVRDPTLEASLGRLVVPMVAALGARGADSTGIGIYQDPVPGRCRLSVHRDGPLTGWPGVREKLASALGRPVELTAVADAAQLLVAAAEEEIEAAESDPADVLPSAGSSGPSSLQVELDGVDYHFDDWAPGMTLLEHLQGKGIAAPFS